MPRSFPAPPSVLGSGTHGRWWSRTGSTSPTFSSSQRWPFARAGRHWGLSTRGVFSSVSTKSTITKVIWHGYSGDGKFVMGCIGPYGLSEISMSFFFNLVAAFILPLAVTCLLFPSLRRLFPDLAWLTGTRRRRAGRAGLRGILVRTHHGVEFGRTCEFCAQFGRDVCCPARASTRRGWELSRQDARPIVVFGRGGFFGLCMYLLLLYGVTYVYLRPDGLPSVFVQLFTVVFVAAVLMGIFLHHRREPLPITVRARARPRVAISQDPVCRDVDPGLYILRICRGPSPSSPLF